MLHAIITERLVSPSGAMMTVYALRLVASLKLRTVRTLEDRKAVRLRFQRVVRQLYSPRTARSTWFLSLDDARRPQLHCGNVA